MLTPQIRHYELRQKFPDTLILAINLPPATLFLIFFKKIKNSIAGGKKITKISISGIFLPQFIMAYLRGKHI